MRSVKRGTEIDHKYIYHTYHFFKYTITAEATMDTLGLRDKFNV